MIVIFKIKRILLSVFFLDLTVSIGASGRIEVLFFLPFLKIRLQNYAKIVLNKNLKKRAMEVMVKNIIVWFIWLIINLIVIGAASYPLFTNVNEYVWRILGLCLYFVLFFVTPLFHDRKHIVSLIHCLKVVVIVITFSSIEHDATSFLPFLLFGLIVAEAADQLPRNNFFPVLSAGVFGGLFTWMGSDFSLFERIYSMILIVVSGAGLVYYHAWRNYFRELEESHQVLLQEYRQLARRVRDEEELVRREERQMIGQEIHDSVGHNLTSLIMQFEALRLKSTGIDEEQLNQLKQLAVKSLDETRRAVKTFKQREVGGLQGVIRLIRKLEVENFIRISFSVKNGAFAAPLTGEQSFAIYRAVQEGLTNLMKHGPAREAEVIFDAPGGSILRFEIVNPVKDQEAFREGYGLSSMRERLEKHGGGIEVMKNKQQFILRGWVRIMNQEESV